MATIDLTITFSTPLHIGNGTQTGPSGPVNTIVRDGRGRPCIPAVTLKGLHRAATEQIAAGLGLTICDAPIAAHMCHPTHGQEACAVCRIFGSPWLPGVIFHRDLTTTATPIVGTSVSAPQSRRRRVRMALHNRNREALPGGLALSGRIDHMIQDTALLALALAGLRSITAIGAAKAIGYGLCSVEARAFDAFRRPVDEAELARELRQFQQARSEKGQP